MTPYFRSLFNHFDFLRALDDTNVLLENTITGAVVVYDLNSDTVKTVA
jgi:hypothetical protein